MSSEAHKTPPPSSRTRIVAEALVAVLGFAAVAFAWRLDRLWFATHLTHSYCVEDVKQLHRLTAVRVGFVLAGALLLFVIRPLLGKWLAKRSLKSAALSTMRIVLAVALALGVSTVILSSKKQNANVIPPPALPHIRLDPEVGWTGDIDTQTTLPGDRGPLAFAFDDAGNRKASPDTVIDPDAPSIVFAGESITEGIGVIFAESYPALVAADLHVQPVEAAVHGYGNDQIYWATEKALAKLRHPVAVVTFTIPELLERNLDTSRPRLMLGPGDALVKVPADPPPPAWWKNFPLRTVAHGLFPYHDDSGPRVARAIFRATANEARARGAFPLFVIANWNSPCLPPEPGTPSLAHRLFDGLDVAFVDLTLDPNAMERTTHHPNPIAHRALADAIEKALIDAKVAAK